MGDIQIGLLDLKHFGDTKQSQYNHHTIGRAVVANVLETDFSWFDTGDWFRPEKEIVRDLMLAGF